MSTRWDCSEKKSEKYKRGWWQGVSRILGRNLFELSPTCSKEQLSGALTIMTSNGSKINLINIQNAFLQNEDRNFQRNANLVLPQKIEVQRVKLWRAKKCVDCLNSSIINQLFVLKSLVYSITPKNNTTHRGRW